MVTFDPGIYSLTASGFFIDVQPYLSTGWSELHVGSGYVENAPQVKVQASGNIIVIAVASYILSSLFTR